MNAYRHVARVVVALAVFPSAAPSAAKAAITLNNQGDSVSLQAVLNDPDRTVHIFDKTFVFTDYQSGDFAASAVFVRALISPNPLDGTGFDLVGGFGDVTPGNLTASGLNLKYTVEVNPTYLALGYRLKDLGLVFNGSASGAGSFARVDEDIFEPPLAGALLASLDVFAPGTVADMQDFHDFTPIYYSKWRVDKTATFFAASTGDTAGASFIRQAFSQVIIPAPGVLVVLGMGGLAVGRRRTEP